MQGTRIPVDIIRRLAAGLQVSDVLEDYPHLQVEDVKAALEEGGGGRRRNRC